MGRPEDMRLATPDTPEAETESGSLPEVKFTTRIRCLLLTLEHISPAFCAVWKEYALDFTMAVSLRRAAQVQQSGAVVEG